jgi:hypothetical protein
MPMMIKNGVVMTKSQYTSSTSGVTYYTVHVAVQGCADMIDIAVDLARFTQMKEMETVQGNLGYSRGRFELLSSVGTVGSVGSEKP